MAIFDRRLSRVFVRDGFNGTVDIDDMSITAGDTTLEVDPTTLDLIDDVTVVPVGARFTIESDETIYTVTSQLASQTYTLTISMASGGTYDLEFDGQQITGIAHNADATAIALAINTVMGAGTVSVTGSGPWTIEFIGGDYANVAVSGTIDDGDLMGGGSEEGTLVEADAGGETRQITFSPPLTLAELPTTADTIHFTSQQIEVELGQGNFSFTESVDREYRLSRGRLNKVRNLDEQPLEVSFEADWEFVRTGTGEAITFPDALKGVGGAAGWFPSSEDPCEPYCCTLVLVYEPDCGGADIEQFTFREFRHDSLDFDMEAASISVTGRCNITEVEIERIPQ